MSTLFLFFSSHTHPAIHLISSPFPAVLSRRRSRLASLLHGGICCLKVQTVFFSSKQAEEREMDTKNSRHNFSGFHFGAFGIPAGRHDPCAM
jgi:hypothetical protein